MVGSKESAINLGMQIGNLIDAVSNTYGLLMFSRLIEGISIGLIGRGGTYDYLGLVPHGKNAVCRWPEE